MNVLQNVLDPSLDIHETAPFRFYSISHISSGGRVMRVNVAMLFVLAVPLSLPAADEPPPKTNAAQAQPESPKADAVKSVKEAAKAGLKGIKEAEIPLGWISGTSGSGGTEEESYWLHPNTLVWEGVTVRPIAWFGACKEGKGQPRYLYFCVFKSPDAKPGEKLPRFLDFPAPEILSISGFSSNEQQKGTLELKLLGKKVSVAHNCNYDEGAKKVTMKSLKFNDKELQEEKSKVFVVDLTGEEVTIQSVDVELPKSVVDLAEKADEDAKAKSKANNAAILKAVDEIKKLPEVKKIVEGEK